MKSSKIDTATLIQDLVETALYNNRQISQAAEALNKAVQQLREEMPAHVSQRVSQSVVPQVSVVAARIAEETAKTMTDKLISATKEANTAAQAYREMTQEARRAKETVLRNAMYVALVTSMAVSLLFSLVMRYFR